jgi:hypothetical protein
MSWIISQSLMQNYANLHSSQELEGEYSAENSLDGEQSAPLKSIHMPQAYLSPDRTTAYSRLSRFGMIFAPLTEDLGEELLTWYLAGFHVRTSVAPVKEEESKVNNQDCGERWPESFVKYDHNTYSWRTHQCCLQPENVSPYSYKWWLLSLGDFGCAQSLLSSHDQISFECWETLPKWGTMRNGECSERTTPVLPTSGKGSGFWPTPVAHDDGKTPEAHMRMKANMSGGERHKPTSLTVMVKGVERGLWPTPRSTDGSHGGRVTPRKSRNGGNLIEAVSKEMFPTPTVNDSKNNGAPSQAKRNSPNLNSVIGGSLNPTWVEWLMGWPLGWTDLRPLEMDKFRQWLHSHGIH